MTEKGFKVVEQDNYGSALTNAKLVEKEIKNEITEGRYIIVKEKPTIVSALGAVIKKSGSARIIHDGSKPEGYSLNSFAVLHEKKKFETIRNAEALIHKGYYLAKIDLKAAYRSVLIHPSQYRLTGLKWKFAGDHEHTYLVDTRLPFGARLAPGIFHELTQAIKYILACQGISGLVVYLDDFLIIEPTKEKCISTLNSLIYLVRRLGFSVAWDKVHGPTTTLTFLGIELDSECMELRLPAEKVESFCELIDSFSVRTRASLRQMQELAGKINWATQVVRAGRLYLRRLFEAIANVKERHHKIVLTAELKDDICWWKQVFTNFNGVRILQLEDPVHRIMLNAEKYGAGMQLNNDWYFLSWQADAPSLLNKGIIDKEVSLMAISLLNWAPRCHDSTVVLVVKDQAAINNFTRGKVKFKPVRDIVNLAIHWAALFNVRIQFEVAPEQYFAAVDCVSRLYEPGYMFMLEAIFGNIPLPLMHVCCWFLLARMSLSALLTIYPQVDHWRRTKRSWQARHHATGLKPTQRAHKEVIHAIYESI